MTFDVFRFTVPDGWKKEAQNGVVRYSRSGGGTYCSVGFYASMRGTGQLEADFKADWQTLVARPLSPDGAPETDKGPSLNGWTSRVGAATFAYQGGTSLAILTTFSGFGAAASVLTLTNDKTCVDDADRLFASLTLSKPATPPGPAASTPVKADASVAPASAAPLKSAYTFNTTNFDDGWVAVEQADWVLVRKGNVTLRLHYPNAVTNKYYSDSSEEVRVAWNTLVAPRYDNVQGFRADYNSMTYERPFLAAASARSRDTGIQGYVALFQQSKSGWIEVVTPDKATFVKTFGVDIDRMNDLVGSEPWQALRALGGYNRFAVAPADLTGKWTSDFSGMLQWVNAYTGLNAGATAHSSNESFDFQSGGRYSWALAVASGPVGTMSFQNAKSTGKLSMTGNWTINFSEIERKPRVYSVYFSAVKGGRVLWLKDTSYGDFKAFVRVK